MASRPKEKKAPLEPSPGELARDEKAPQPRRPPAEDVFEEKGPPGGYGGAGCPEEEEL